MSCAPGVFVFLGSAAARILAGQMSACPGPRRASTVSRWSSAETIPRFSAPPFSHLPPQTAIVVVSTYFRPRAAQVPPPVCRSSAVLVPVSHLPLSHRIWASSAGVGSNVAQFWANISRSWPIWARASSNMPDVCQVSAGFGQLGQTLAELWPNLAVWSHLAEL